MTPAKRSKRVEQDKTLDALIEELLRIRQQDPPLSDVDIRAIRVQGRP
jgi:hypothetical protein